MNIVYRDVCNAKDKDQVKCKRSKCFSSQTNGRINSNFTVARLMSGIFTVKSEAFTRYHQTPSPPRLIPLNTSARQLCSHKCLTFNIWHWIDTNLLPNPFCNVVYYLHRLQMWFIFIMFLLSNVYESVCVCKTAKWPGVIFKVNKAH